MKFKIVTLGCKVNAYESTVIKEKMLKEGFIESDNNADIVIVNTCSVTNVADSKCLKMVRRLKREDPNAIFVVCGCSVQNDKTKFENLDIDVLLGNTNKSKIVDLIKEEINNKHLIDKVKNDMQHEEFETMEIDKFSNVRAFVKIQDGCNNYCSYCIIPYLRGNLRCKDYDEVINESKNLVKNGHKEIVLTGIHTGSYKSKGKDIVDVIWGLSEINGLERIRLSSIEITEINNDKFYDLLKRCDKLCNHLHIPLQAGSNEILKRMNRKYDLDYYFDVINKIRSIRPDISISTDVIVGHPYETEELFNTTIDTCEKIRFSKIHVFPYSKREGTVASKMPEHVKEEDKKIRSNKLIQVSTELEKEYYDKFIGNKLGVLIEEEKNGKYIGHTSNMLKLCLDGKYNINEIYDVVIKGEFYDA